MRGFDRDLIRGEHYGQRSCEPHSKAEHMAPREMCDLSPQTGPKRTFDRAALIQRCLSAQPTSIDMSCQDSKFGIAGANIFPPDREPKFELWGQSQDCQGARPLDPRIVPAARRQGDRIEMRRFAAVRESGSCIYLSALVTDRATEACYHRPLLE